METAENKTETKTEKQGFVRHGEVLFTVGEPHSFFFTVKDPAGIHARPAGALVKLAKKYKSRITFSLGEKTADADSILSLMNLGAGSGARLKAEAHGEDEREALLALREYICGNL